HRRRVGEQNLNMTGDQVIQRRHSALVRYVRHLSAGKRLEQFSIKMMRGADAARAEAQLARIVFGVLDELGDALYRQVIVDHKEEGYVRKHRDRLEVLYRGVGDFFLEGWVGLQG